MSEKIDWQRPIQTRDGRKAEFLRHINVSNAFSVLVLLTDEEGDQESDTYTEEGRCYKREESVDDVVNVAPMTEEVETGATWCNVYRQSEGLYFSSSYSSREEVARLAGSGCIGQWQLPPTIAVVKP